MGDRSIQIQESAVGSAIVSGDGNVVNVIYQVIQQSELETVGTSTKFGPNPYRGLAAFTEKDSDRYFGREAQVQRLWQRLRTLYEQSAYPDAVPRLLPILGPSGCGKSSLALAGLLPALTRRPLPSIASLRVAVMRPGAQPLEALAGVLAKVAFGDSMPVAKTREFTEELSRRGDDGLRRIVALMPQITASPLVLLVDQFEETYSLCKDPKVRLSFIDNLLCAAVDPTGNVSVVITLRSDFLGETQRHQGLNQVIGSDQSAILPAMTVAELGRAIAEPAKRAGHPLDAAVVDRLVQDVEGREGALPLLQYALFRIWEGLEAGREPLETYLAMGGVGGALASKAEEIYTALSALEQKIAERIFIGLVQVGEGDRDTRRQVSVKSLVTRRYGFAQIRVVIDKYSGTGARFITLATDGNGEMVAEVSHEALFKNWKRFMDWLGDRRNDIRLQQRLESAAIYWDKQGRPPGLLWRPPDLDLLRTFTPTTDLPLNPHCYDFFYASDKAERRQRQIKRLGITGLATGLVLTIGLSVLVGYQVRQTERRQIQIYQTEAKLPADPLTGMVSGLAAIGLGYTPWIKLPRLGGDGLVSAAILEPSNRHARFNRVVGGHEDWVSSVAISPDGETVVSGGLDGTVRLWDRQGQPIGEPFQGHAGGVRSVAMSSDGETVVSGGADGTVRLWDGQGQPIGEPFQGHAGGANSVAISSDGETVVSGGRDGTVRLWTRQGQPIGAPFQGHAGGVNSVAISPDGETVVSGGLDGTVRLWTRQGQPIGAPFQGHNGMVLSVAMSPDGETVVSGGEDGTVRLWDSQGQPIGAPFQGHNGMVLSVAISPDGETVVSGGEYGRVWLWNRQGKAIGEPFQQGYGHNRVWSVALSLDGETVVSGSEDGTVRLWERYGQPIGAPFEGHDGGVLDVAMSSDGEAVVSGSMDGTVRLWTRQGQHIGETFQGHDDVVWSVAMSPDGRTVVSGSEDGTVRLWDRQGQPIGNPFQGHNGMVLSVAMSPDGETVVSGGLDGLWLWDRQGQPIEGGLHVPDNPVWSVAMSPDGKTVVSGGADGTVRLWDGQGQPIGNPFQGHASGVRSVAMSLDGETVVSGSEDGTVRLWDSQGQPIGEPFQGHNGMVLSVAMSPDGETVVSGSEDGTVRLWNRRGQPIGEPFQGHDGGVNPVAISPDGETVVSGGADGTVRLWPVWLAEVGWVRYTCNRIRPYLIARSETDETVRLARRTCERHAWR